MSIRIIGMIGVTAPSSDATLHVIEGGLSPNYVTEAARAHEAAGFDLVLVGYSSSSAEGFLVALHAAEQTKRLGYLIAHRPGFVAPTLMARKIATFDHLTGGRLAVHIITGKTDDEQEGDGDFTPKGERYRRAAEYLEIDEVGLVEREPFDFAGEFYRVNGAHSDVRPLQKPHPPLFFGGASEGALEMGARLCDVYAIYAEPLASTRERMKEFRGRAAAFGRTRDSMSRCVRSLRRAKARPGTRRTGDSCGHDRRKRQKGLEPAGGDDRPGRQRRTPADELCARK